MHDLIHQSNKDVIPVLGLHLPNSLVACTSQAARYAHLPRCRAVVRRWGGDDPCGLDAGLFIGAKEALVLLQVSIFPAFVVQIQNASGFAGEIRISRKDPTAMFPGSNGIFVEPAPQRGVTNGSSRPGQRTCSTVVKLDTAMVPVRTFTFTLVGELTVSDNSTLTGAGADSSIIEADTAPGLPNNFRVLRIQNVFVGISDLTLQDGNLLRLNGDSVFNSSEAGVPLSRKQPGHQRQLQLDRSH